MQTKSNEKQSSPAATPSATMTSDEVMGLLGIGRRALMSAVDRREIPTCWPHKVGKRWPKEARFPRAAVEKIAHEGQPGRAA